MLLCSRLTPRLIRWLVPALTSISAACALGCSSDSDNPPDPPVDSGRFETAELDADISVSAQRPGWFEVEAILERDTPTKVDDVRLSDGDSFRATAPDGQQETLERAIRLGRSTQVYDALFETSPAAGLVRLRFRDSNFEILLRPEFSVTSPTRGQLFGFQDDLPITWTPAEPGAVMRISIVIVCPGTTVSTRSSTSVHQVADTGSFDYDLSLNPLATNPLVDTSKDCSLDVDLVREVSIPISPPFESTSEMRSTQSRTVDDVLVTF